MKYGILFEGWELSKIASNLLPLPRMQLVVALPGLQGLPVPDLPLLDADAPEGARLGVMSGPDHGVDTEHVR